MARILVVDDEEYIRSLLRRALSMAGHEVTEAIDGNDALAQFREARPDLVFTDLMMPGLGGLELIDLLRKESADVKIIAMSVLGHDAFPKARQMGAGFTFEKPFRVDEVLAAVEELLRGEP